MKIFLMTACLCFLVCALGIAQTKRFDGNYPLNGPGTNKTELKEEVSYVLTAIIGGAKLAQHSDTPKKRIDEEALITEDFRLAMLSMTDYLIKVSEASASGQKADFESLKKQVKGKKYDKVISKAKGLGAKFEGTPQEVFFVCKDYISDLEAEMPWTKINSYKVTKTYRKIIKKVAEDYKRPFGPKAELGAVMAESAQALSNCIEYPERLTWTGTGRILFEEDDQLRHLVGCIAYIEWRLNTTASGRRSAHFDRTEVQKLKHSLYSVVESMLADKKDWLFNVEHGANLEELHRIALSKGWSFDGERARKS